MQQNQTENDDEVSLESVIEELDSINPRNVLEKGVKYLEELADECQREALSTKNWKDSVKQEESKIIDLHAKVEQELETAQEAHENAVDGVALAQRQVLQESRHKAHQAEREAVDRLHQARSSFLQATRHATDAVQVREEAADQGGYLLEVVGQARNLAQIEGAENVADETFCEIGDKIFDLLEDVKYQRSSALNRRMMAVRVLENLRHYVQEIRGISQEIHDLEILTTRLA